MPLLLLIPTWTQTAVVVIPPPVIVTSSGGSGGYTGMERTRRAHLAREIQAALEAPPERYPAKKRARTVDTTAETIERVDRVEPAVALPLRRLEPAATLVIIRRTVVVTPRPMPVVAVHTGSRPLLEGLASRSKLGRLTVSAGARPVVSGLLGVYGNGPVSVVAVQNPSDDELLQQHFTYLQAA